MIYLLRHGDAEDGNGDDAARRLTGKGRRQATAAGEALAEMNARIDACLTSPKLRAAETAEGACRALGITAESAEALRGGPFDALQLAAGRGNVLLVGHQPDLSNEIARLCGGKVKMKKAGLAILDGGTLLSLTGPEELELIAARAVQRAR